MTAQITIRDYENLSAYLDGQLSNKDKAHIEERMRTNPDLRRAFDEMSRTRMLLRSAPRHRAPRNFTLTPAMVGAQKRKTGGLFGYFPVLSFASAVATLALVLTFIFNTGPVPLNTASAPMPDQAAPAADQSQLKVAEEATDTAEVAAPQAAPSMEMAAQPEATSGEQVPGGVVTWGFPPNSYSSAGKLPMGGVPDGRGGGGGGGGMGGVGDPGSMGAVLPDGQMIVPYDSAPTLPQAESAVAATQADSYAGIPTVEGTGPILGVPAEGQGGQYLNPLPTAMPPLSEESAREAVEAGDAQAVQETSAGFLGLSSLTWVQILLGLLAMVTGIVAWWIWKKNR